MIGALNRGKTFKPETIELIRQAAINRPPMSEETRAKVSANSAKAQYYSVSKADGSLLPNGETTIILRTINTVADFCKCNERTVRRALTANKLVKNTFKVVIASKPS